MGGPSRVFIVEEIRRCAAENGGVPLGRARFRTATGIREADWIGKYWPRWGDALVEAGFEPNELQGVRQSDEELLAALARLTRDLGHYPSNPEVRLQRQVDPNFPSHNTFANRLGTRPTQIRKLAAFVGAHPEFAPVAALLQPQLDEAAPQGDHEENGGSPETSSTFGHVYLLKLGKHYKIGRSNAFGRRERELAIQMPERAVTVHVITTDDPVGIERYWHQRFADRRVRPDAEWFLLERDDVAAFKRRAFQ
ncbi:MAG: GIY-YIG nuclease family protein [Candidatus Nanopelagicales bacterium]|nr:GIY-YIG nuclease family protein [Candidatus Nanopelagicales bacterium]